MDGIEAINEWSGYAVAIARKVMARRGGYSSSFGKDAEQVALIELFRCGNVWDSDLGEFKSYISVCISNKVRAFRDSNTYLVTPKNWHYATAVLYREFLKQIKADKVPTPESVHKVVTDADKSIGIDLVKFWFEVYYAEDSYYTPKDKRSKDEEPAEDYQHEYEDTAGDEAVEYTNNEAALVSELLGELEPKDASIIDMYYGISTGIPMNLREIAELEGISKEGIRKRLV